MNQIWNHNHYWLPTLDLLVSSTTLILYTMSLSPSSIEEECIFVLGSRQNLPNSLEFPLEILVLLAKNFKKLFDISQFKIRNICGLTKFQLLSGTLWSSMSTKSWLIFLNFLHFFICLPNFCSLLYTIIYFSFIFHISLFQFFTRNVWINLRERAFWFKISEKIPVI